jgi:Leucine-rich repeat (LRR) protein
MQTADHLLSELRSLVHAEQDHDARWHALTAMLDTWPADLIAPYALPYLDGALREDTSEREAPSHWITIKAQGVEVHPGWPLVRAVTWLGAPDLDVAALARSTALRGIERLKLRLCQLDEARIRALTEHAPLT